MIPDPAPPYTVSTLGRAYEDLKGILTRAVNLGLRSEAEAIFFQLDDALRQRPRGWGDPIRNFRHLQMVQYHGLLYPLVAVYSVHDRLPFVVLSHVYAVKGHPLAGL